MKKNTSRHHNSNEGIEAQAIRDFEHASLDMKLQTLEEIKGWSSWIHDNNFDNILSLLRNASATNSPMKVKIGAISTVLTFAGNFRTGYHLGSILEAISPNITQFFNVLSNDLLQRNDPNSITVFIHFIPKSNEISSRRLIISICENAYDSIQKRYT
eukprot:TRINITY_DN4664_c0_g1_i2.p1 TRINITY_DN4664_c0_g1~~TRINITY_DN4664_c0_g1_i2.p1  ORF type:complete len:157 (-),score=23.99 TRINITY_DN4664_c0_g1_i2:96-566(-)